jgi:CheY-like chemotaxis protein
MTKQVMIVEDNELNMKLFRDLIEASGYKTDPDPQRSWKRWTSRGSIARISF